MDEKNQKNVQTLDLWVARGILTIALIVSFENNVRKIIFQTLIIVRV